MQRLDRLLSVVGGGLQLLWLLINLPFLLFGALMTLVRTGIGLVLLVGLGSCASDLSPALQARALDKVLAGREAPRERGLISRSTSQRAADRRREEAAAARARARYHVEERRLIAQGRGR